MKKVIKILSFSIGTTLVLMLVLLLTRNYLLNYLVDYIETIRGTAHYEGETKAVEFLYILTRIITPIILVMTLVFYGYFLRDSQKSR